MSEEDKCLFVAPRSDEATEYSFSWASKLLTKIGNSLNLIKLLQNDAVYFKMNQYINSVTSMIFFDHGNEECLVGQDGFAFMDMDDTSELKDKKVYTMACLSAKKFGAEAYNKGCKEYWGAVEAIGFTLEEADLFGDVYIEGAYKRFVENKSIEETYQSMQDHFDQQKTIAVNPWTKIWLQKDKDMWVVWHSGNPPIIKELSL